MELGALTAGRRLGTHALRHSYTRQRLMSSIPPNYLKRRLGRSEIEATPIYLELVPGPSGTFTTVL